ncbi:MAG: hypothetical protein GX195_07645 [Firmicutes bacterium]|jgi:glucosamine kinase|nr:hypothetical protein [Bacillota bacterium]
MFIVGADCGGTSTKVMVADSSGQMVGRGKSGPANYAVDGYDRVMQRVREATEKALDQIGASWDEMLANGAVLAAGVSGTSIPGSGARLMEGWRELGFRDVVVHTDAVVALAGALSGEDGAIVISGTGSIGLGKWAGRYVQMGGWGYLLGDEGSSFWIAREVLRGLLRGRDGMVERDLELEETVLEHFQVAAVEDVMRIFYEVPINRGYLGSLTPVIVRLAQAGNATCKAIIGEAGRELGLLAGAVVAKLETQSVPCRVGACGGVFSAGQIILEPMQAALVEKAPHARLSLPDFDPAVGALLVGFERLGIAAAEILPSLEGSVKEKLTDA